MQASDYSPSPYHTMKSSSGASRITQESGIIDKGKTIFVFRQRPRVDIYHSGIFFPFSYAMLLSCRHCSHFIPEEGKHLVYLVYSQSLLSLFQLAHKAKPHTPALAAKSTCVSPNRLRISLTNNDNELFIITPFRVPI